MHGSAAPMVRRTNAGTRGRPAGMIRFCAGEFDRIVARKRKPLTAAPESDDVSAFLAKVAATPPPARRDGVRGRLLFAMDATASREPSWDQACQIQGAMFQTTASLGGLDVQLCFYRGFNEFNATGWVADARALAAQMSRVRCAGGATQIGRVLAHAKTQSRERRLNALVFVGDCVEEDPDRLCAAAGELGLLGVPAFMFHEGGEAVAGRTFREIARLTRGAYCRFEPGSAEQLRQLLSAVAVYAAGGRAALRDFSQRHGELTRLLAHQVD